MGTALIYLGASIFSLVVLTVLFKLEDKYGGRLVLGRLREAGDTFLVSTHSKSGSLKGIGYVRITWHYFVHRILRRIMDVVSRLHTKLDRSLQKNKAAARELREGANNLHLPETAAHTEEVSVVTKKRTKRKLVVQGDTEE